MTPAKYTKTFSLFIRLAQEYKKKTLFLYIPWPFILAMRWMCHPKRYTSRQIEAQIVQFTRRKKSGRPNAGIWIFGNVLVVPVNQILVEWLRFMCVAWNRVMCVTSILPNSSRGNVKYSPASLLSYMVKGIFSWDIRYHKQQWSAL